MTKRLVKIAKELNVGTTTIVEYLNNNGYSIENKPTAKVTDEMYDELLKEFQKCFESISSPTLDLLLRCIWPTNDYFKLFGVSGASSIPADHKCSGGQHCHGALRKYAAICSKWAPHSQQVREQLTHYQCQLHVRQIRNATPGIPNFFSLDWWAAHKHSFLYLAQSNLTSPYDWQTSRLVQPCIHREHAAETWQLGLH